MPGGLPGRKRVVGVTKRFSRPRVPPKRLLSRLACSDTILWATDRQSLQPFESRQTDCLHHFGENLCSSRGPPAVSFRTCGSRSWVGINFSSAANPLFFSFAMG